MAKIRCDYCHEMVEKSEIWRHIADHRKLRDDGQQSEYVTLPPEERLQGELDDVPTVYNHSKCGQATVMPEEIVRSYLKNPFLYSSSTYCSGCEKHVPHRQCQWAETGENLEAYFNRLKADHLKSLPSWRRILFKSSPYIPYIVAALALLIWWSLR